MTNPTTMKRALAKADPVLGRHMERVGKYGLQINDMTSLYEALAESIVYQQLTGKAAATIFGRVKALGGSALPAPKKMIALDDSALRGAGLSRAKTAAIKDLAARVHSGELPTLDEAHTLDDDKLKERLTIVRGIGPWSVEMLLMFRLGRPDVLPVTDYGIRKGFQKVFRQKELPSPQKIMQRGERWRPYRTMASWYLWRALDTVGARS